MENELNWKIASILYFISYNLYFIKNRSCKDVVGTNIKGNSKDVYNIIKIVINYIIRISIKYKK